MFTPTEYTRALRAARIGNNNMSTSTSSSSVKFRVSPFVFQLLIGLLLVFLGGLDGPRGGVSACGDVKSTLATKTAGGGGGRATDVTAPAVTAAAASATEWPEGMPGVWTGEYLGGSDITSIKKGMKAMVGFMALVIPFRLCFVVL